MCKNSFVIESVINEILVKGLGVLNNMYCLMDATKEIEVAILCIITRHVER